MKFDDLGLAEPILRAVAAEGYDAPTPIQARAIPALLEGRDVLGCAQTGTGKTGAFAMPTLHRLADPDNPRDPRAKRSAPRALVLCPTRELATQIFESFRTYGRGLKLRCGVIYGGVGQNPQVAKLKAGVDILVATPGRLLDLMGQGFVDLRAVETLILDEADRMLDMGFIHDIRKIAQRTPDDRQTVMFSATMPPPIRKLAGALLHEPAVVSVAPQSTTAEAIEQSVYMVAKNAKPVLLQRLLQRNGMGRTLVFTRTKHGADRLVKKLGQAGLDASAIHGNKSQGARRRALDAFKSGATPVLVATDVASRGIDVDGVTHVVNYDLPNDAETYVHRIGRTARAGASGVALSFCDREERAELRQIEKLLGARLDVIDHDVRPADAPRDQPAAEPRAPRNAPRPKPRPGQPKRRKPQPKAETAGTARNNNTGGAKRTRTAAGPNRRKRRSGPPPSRRSAA